MPDTWECLTDTREAARPVRSTILEMDWTADMNSFATTRMLLSSSRHFKHSQTQCEYCGDPTDAGSEFTFTNGLSKPRAQPHYSTIISPFMTIQ
jgi:hypothetical protein